MVHLVLLAGCAIVIYLACEWFVNAVEWLGARMKIGAIAVGTILAALGTALPESIVTLAAVAFGHGEERKAIGVGAAMGGPLALSTIAYAVAGLMLFRKKSAEPIERVDLPRLASDQQWFLLIFVFKVGLGLVVFSWKPWLGLVFFAAYVAYFISELRRDGEVAESDHLEPLKMQPKRATPQTWAVVLQTIVTLVLVFGASQLFVGQLEWVGPKLGLPSTVVALLLSPIATELPEIMNAVIWVRQGKINLALANISGSMMIQATVPSGIGIIFTTWKFDGPLIVSGAVTMAAIAYLLICIRSGHLSRAKLLSTASLYGVFALSLIPLT